mgnify:CR=1 FL=1
MLDYRPLGNAVAQPNRWDWVLLPLILGVLLIGFTLTDGYDLGVATLLPFIARTNEERRLAINSISGPGVRLSSNVAPRNKAKVSRVGITI